MAIIMMAWLAVVILAMVRVGTGVAVFVSSTSKDRFPLDRPSAPCV